jgi:hypothetical protein
MKLCRGLGRHTSVFLYSFTVCLTCACDPDPEPGTDGVAEFESTPEKSAIVPGIINEASGLAPSRNMDGFLWTIQDSGNPASLYLISKDGKSIKEYKVPGATNRDWEDVASGPGPNNGTHYLYIGETGNNNQPVAATSIIYRIPEIADQNASFNGSSLEKITYKYPDGPRDAEALMVDPGTKDIFIISKEATETGIYRLPFPQSTGETITAEKVGTIPGVFMVTSGDVSGDGSEILIRTYLAAYYWKKKDGETIGLALARTSDRQVSVTLEPQGEAICFDRQVNGFYTISEKSNASSVSLNYYKRK